MAEVRAEKKYKTNYRKKSQTTRQKYSRYKRQRKNTKQIIEKKVRQPDRTHITVKNTSSANLLVKNVSLLC